MIFFLRWGTEMPLMNNSEVVGRLGAVTNENGMLHLTFAIQTEVEIPEKAISFTELKKYVGTRVGIFHLKDGEYRIRTIK